MSGVIDVSKIPSQTLRIIGSGGLQVPQGSTSGQYDGRPEVPVNNGQKHGFDGTIRWNRTTNVLEYCSNGIWLDILDKSSASTTYVSMQNATLQGNLDMAGFAIKNLKISATYDNSDAVPYQLLKDSYLPLDGGTMVGTIDMGGYGIKNLLAPINGKDAVNLDYVAANFATFNSPYTAALNMNGNRIYNLSFMGDATSEDDAISKRYGDFRWLIKNHIEDTGSSGDSMIGPLTIRGNKTPIDDKFLGGTSEVKFSNLIGDVQATIGLTSGSQNFQITVDGTSSDRTIDLDAKGMIVPRGETLDRPLATTNGMLRYNTTTKAFEVVIESTWVNLSTSADLQTAKTELTANLEALDQSLRTYIAQELAKVKSVPVGAIFMCPSDQPLPNCILLNGATYSRTEKAELFNYANSSGAMASSEATKLTGQFGPGDGSTTFTVPDWRGLFPRGNDNGRNVDVNRQLGSIQDHSVKNHTHNLVGDKGTQYYVLNSSSGGSDTGSYTTSLHYSSQSARWYPYTGNISTGDGVSNETRPINVSTNFCMSY